MKKVFKIIAVLTALLMISVSSYAAELAFENYKIHNKNVSVDVTLDAIPDDLSDLSAITIKYDFDESIMEYISTTSKICDGIVEKAGSIVWFDTASKTANSKKITSDMLSGADNVLFTLNFEAGAPLLITPDVKIKFVQLADESLNKSEEVTFDYGSDDENEDNESGNEDNKENNENAGTGDNNGSEDNAGDSNNSGGSGNAGNSDGSGNAGNSGGSGNAGNSGGSGNAGNSGGSGNAGNSAAVPSKPVVDNSKKEDTTENKGTASNTTNKEEINKEPAKEVKENTFSDLTKDNWAYPHANSLFNKGIVAGDGAAVPAIRPSDNITREEAAILVLRAMGIAPEADLPLDFADAADVSPWAAPHIATAVKYGILKGADGKVNPKNLITREEMVVLLSRAFNWELKDGVLNFADGSEVADWSKTAIVCAVEKGIMQGSNNQIRPKATITRAETFVLVDKCLNK